VIAVDEDESLRTPGSALAPDSRSTMFSIIGSRPMTLEDRHSWVAAYRLDRNIPEAIRIHFETAKNLYLYAWFVYRFHNVAEQQALTTLEFALREIRPRPAAWFGVATEVSG
jgi:hypothetical protein